MTKKPLKPLKDYRLSSPPQAQYIITLDRDPVLAARALTKKDIKKCYKLLRETFEEIKEDKIYHEPMAHTLLYSSQNFKWFATMLKELEILLGEDEYEIPFDKCPSIFISDRFPNMYPPFHVGYRDKKLKLYNYKVLSKKLQIVNSYRIKYIMENYDMSDFIDDAYPEWYLIKNTTVFEQYSEKTNTRVRIDFRDGEFMYFIAGASDNWQQIEQVPEEMDHVIAALLFRSYSDNF